MLNFVIKVFIPLIPVLVKFTDILLDKWKDSTVHKNNKEISKLPLTIEGQEKQRKFVKNKEKVQEAHKKFNEFLRDFRDTRKQLKIKN